MALGFIRGLRLPLVLALTSLSGCYSDTAPPGTVDTVTVTPSMSGMVNVVSDGSRTVSLTFNSNDGRLITHLAVTGLSTLPAQWSGPATFTCSEVFTGSGCVLNLTYAPTAIGSGTVTLSYGYSDNAGTVGTGSIQIPYASSSNNNIVATAAPPGQINAIVGAGTQTVNVTFTTDDGNPASALALTTALSSLPEGWSSSASSFGCSTVATGSGCLLALSYAPSVVGSGTLTLNYNYVDNAGTAKTGSINMAYASTSNNNVVATAAPPGQINAVVGAGSQAVNVTFTTDDGNPATGLALTTALGTLPSGWSSTASSFNCASVSTGSGCLLTLSYAPSLVGSGTLTLSYGYTDNAGTSKTGSLNMTYASTSNNNVVGTAAPAGQINAVVGAGSQAVNVTFTTDDGNPASTLTLTTDLTTLPSGWSSTASSFSCASVSTGSGCLLSLSYAPSVVGSGTVTLHYTYTDNAGVAKTGSVNIAYASTSNNNVVGTASPSGQINAVLGAGTQAVSVIFTTDDGNPATGLALTTALSALPGGWSSTDSSFTCSSVSTGTGCQLPLTYAPTLVGSGTVTLHYSYTDNAGVAKTGSVNIPYAATANDNVVGTPSPSSVNIYVNNTQAVGVTFTTDDGNTATGLSITTDLTSLPSGWSSTASSFSCSSVSTGSSCLLSLNYAPTLAASGTLVLNDSYTDNAGVVKTGSVSVPYVATVAPPRLYIGQFTGAAVSSCAINGSNGTLSTCAATSSGSASPSGMAFNGNYVYTTDYENELVYVCTVATNGSLSNCSNTSATTGYVFFNPWALAVQGNYLYVTASYTPGSHLSYCLMGGDGSLSGCTTTSGLVGTVGIAIDASHAYLSTFSGNVNVCTVNPNGSLTACATTGSGFNSPDGITLSGGYAYVANNGNNTVSVCAINGTTGALSACTASSIGSAAPDDVAINGSYAYVSDRNGYNIYVCTVSGTNGTLSGCTISDGGASFHWPEQIAIH